jgi:hypothetical protein
MNMNDFKLDNEPKITSGFSIPENYFDTFSEKVMQKLPVNEPKVISLWDRNKKWIYGLAAVLVLSFSIPIMNVIKSNNSDADTAEIENYLTQHSTLSDDDIVELLDTEDLKKINLNNNIEDTEVENLLSGNSNLEEYITN